MDSVLCKHEVLFGKLCVNCGAEVIDNNNHTKHQQDITILNSSAPHTNHENVSQPLTPLPSFVPHALGRHTLLMSIDAFANQAIENGKRMMSVGKLALVIDLDHTIVHTCSLSTTEEQWERQYKWYKQLPIKIKDTIIQYRSPSTAQTYPYLIRIRPGTREFLEELNRFFELYVFTFGLFEYANYIVNYLDPNHTFFQNRALTRTDLRPDCHYKDISRLVCCPAAMISIVDDSPSMWLGFEEQVLQVHPYCFWPTSWEQTESDEVHFVSEEADNMLTVVRNVLLEAHRLFYDLPSSSSLLLTPDQVNQYWNGNYVIPWHDTCFIFRALRTAVLSGVCITFTAVLDRTRKHNSQAPWQWAERFGAEVEKGLSERTTHLVFGFDIHNEVTQKVHQAKNSPDIMIVHLSWLWACCSHFHLVSELPFSLHTLSSGGWDMLHDDSSDKSNRCSTISYCGSAAVIASMTTTKSKHGIKRKRIDE